MMQLGSENISGLWILTQDFIFIFAARDCLKPSKLARITTFQNILLHVTIPVTKWYFIAQYVQYSITNTVYSNMCTMQNR